MNTPLWKDGMTPSKRRRRRRQRLSGGERTNKQLVRERDQRCRFPFCGCKRTSVWADPLKAVLTVSHDDHKKMGGDPTGEKSRPERMIALCKWRHQDAPVSRHANTMRTRHLTPDQNDGPVSFEVDLWAVYSGLYKQRGVWFEVAREIEPGVVGLLSEEQLRVLDDLAEMIR